MTQSGFEHPSGCGGLDGANDMAHRMADDLDAALRLLRCLLGCQVEAMREVEAIMVRLLDICRTASRHQGTAGTEKVPESLTRQEARVLEQICQARTNRQIARRLGISEKTAKNYVQAVYRKLHVHSRTEAALIAARHQWFETNANVTE